MGCKKLNTDFFNFLEVIHQKNATAFKKKRSNGDHLGNIRLSYTNVSTTSTPILQIKEENNYYPFGLKMKGFNANINGRHHKYMFGGKEQQDELNLNTYDFGARNYDPALGRWMNLDPLAELMWTWSPYNYSFDSPIYYSDPTGLGPNGSNDIEGYYDLDGTVYFDPKVHGPGDVPAGAKYIDETYYDEGTGTFWDENGKPSSVVEQLDEVSLNGQVSPYYNDDGSPTVWGLFYGHGIQGRRDGKRKGSFDVSDFSSTSGTGAKAGNAFTRLLKFLVELFQYEQNIENAVNSNKSTMAKKVKEEAKNVPDSIIIVLYRTYTGYVNGEAIRFNTVMLPEDSIKWTKEYNLDSIKPIPTTLKIKNNEK